MISVLLLVICQPASQPTNEQLLKAFPPTPPEVNVVARLRLEGHYEDAEEELACWYERQIAWQKDSHEVRHERRKAVRHG